MRPSRASTSIVDGEYLMTAEDFAQIANTLREKTGIVLNDGKASLAYSRLAKRLRILGLQSFADYCDLIGSPDGSEELQAMLAALTTNVTRFFREPHHFDLLHSHIATHHAAKVRAGQRLRLWSAACSNGQEPYSMAMTLMDALPEAPRMDVRILATDIDPNMVGEGRQGVYRSDLLEPVPAAFKKRFFSEVGNDMLSAGQALRDVITFNLLNLIGPWPMKGQFDVIFCRNVAIYFDEPTQEKLWARFAQTMPVGGLLCIGHSERISGPAERHFEACGLTSYIRRAA